MTLRLPLRGRSLFSRRLLRSALAGPLSLGVTLLVAGASGAVAVGPPCLPCAGWVTNDPGAIAAALSAGGPLAEGARLYVAWDLDLGAAGAGGDLAATAQALREAGASPWVRFTFRTAAPLAANGAALDRELGAAAAAAAQVGAGGHFSVLWSPPSASLSAAGNDGASPSASTPPGVDLDPREFSFLLKRAAVAINGAAAEARVIAGPLPADPSFLRALYEEEISAYADGIAFAAGTSSEELAAGVATLAELDPGKPVVRDGAQLSTRAGSPLAVAAGDAARGISLTLFDGRGVASSDLSADLPSLRLLANEFRGDVSYDSASAPASSDSTVWPFVRGEDLSLRVIVARPPAADPASGATVATSTLLFPDPGIRRVARLDPATGREVGLAGRRAAGGVEVTLRAPATETVSVLRLERASAAEVAGVDEIQEKVTITGERQMPVEEILRRLQAFEDAQARRITHYEATNATSLRFLAGNAQSIDATFEGPYFVASGQPADWAWQTLYINGMRWRSKTLPEIPIIEPEKAAAQPLSILLTKEYRYSLRGTATVEGRDCWVIDFAPAGPTEGKRLHQGTVWVDRQLYARVRTKAVQLGLEGNVLSNDEALTYSPIDADGQPAPWTAESFYLPLRMVAQQQLSVVNTTTLLERSTTLREVRINAEGFAERRSAVFASDVTMVRDTAEGLRYLVPAEGGKPDERVVKEGFDASKTFLLGGVFYEESLDYPLPLAGINYLNLDFRGRKQQLNAFFAGALGVLNFADPSLFGSRWDGGADLFALAVPFEDSLYRDGNEITAENVKSRAWSGALNLGHPFGHHGKFGVRYRVQQRDYSEADDTAKDFALPSDTLTHALQVEASYARGGYRLQLGGSMNRRATWEPWGFPGNPEYDPAAKEYTLWNGSLSKVWHLSGFKKLGAEVTAFGGRDLDRFSKYEFGFFGATRVHGYRSDRVRAEKGHTAHLTYGFEVGKVFRLDAVGDAAWATDEAAGLDAEFLAGVGLQGTFLGPWQTIVNLDLGIPVAGPEDGFVLYVVFLKLFK